MNSQENNDIIETIDSTDSYVDGEDVYYTSGQVASMIGISRDLVRYYTNEYEEFLNPDRTKGGHLRYRGDDIETLRLILSLLKKHSAAETKSILRDKDVKLIYANSGDEEKGMLKILFENNKYLADLIIERLENSVAIKQQELLIEQKEKENIIYEELLDNIKSLKEENQEMKNIILEILNKEESKRRKGLFGLFKKKE